MDPRSDVGLIDLSTVGLLPEASITRRQFVRRSLALGGEREVKKALRKTLFKYKLHSNVELFDKGFGYIPEYY